MRLLLDEQHDRHVAEILRREGHDVIAVTESEERGRADRDVLETAASMHRAIITEDVDDFSVLHREFFDAGRTHYGIVLTPQGRFAGKSSRRAFVAELRTLLRAHPQEDALRDELIWLD